MSSLWKEPYHWSVLRVTLDGLSAIDLPMLSIHSPEAARRFLRGYGFDPDRPQDLHRALAIHGEALAFVHRHFLSGTGLSIPEEVSHPSSLTALLMLASDETEAGRTLQPWACAVLRVMHTIAHCDDDLRLRYFREIRGQILENYRQHVVEEGGRLFLGDGAGRVPLVSFKVRERKDRDSVILKLLHRPGNVAEEIFDRIGVRLVMPTKLDALLALRYLRDQQVFSFANIQPEQSKNALVDLPRFLAELDALDPEATEEEARVRLGAVIGIPDGTLHQPESNPANRNPHSLPGYRAIQFTARQRIRVIPHGRRRLQAASLVLDAAMSKAADMTRRIEALLESAAPHQRAALGSLLEDAQEGARALAEAGRHAEPEALEGELSFFFPYEVHILDAASDRENEAGISSHLEYKARQRETARRRVLARLL